MTFQRFFKIFSVLTVAFLAVNTSLSGILETFIAILGFSAFLYFFVFKDNIDFWLELKGWRGMQWIESLSNGGIKEARIFRPLKEYEKLILGFKFLETRDKNYDLDKRSPVFRVIGELNLLGSGEAGRAEVRGFELSRKNNPEQKYQLFNKGTSLAVEFSPFSKTVWDIYAVLGDRRVWQMNFPAKNLQDIKDSRRTVDLRAPFGSHNLEQIKVGDFITFTDSSRLVSLPVKVERVSFYKTLGEAVGKEGAKNILPDSEDEVRVVNYFKNLASYDARVKQAGVYAIKFVYKSPQEILDMLRYRF
jgi:ASC-1-like (ASCH) protein